MRTLCVRVSGGRGPARHPDRRGREHLLALTDPVRGDGWRVGFLTVLGIAARNGILLIDHYRHLARFEGEAFGPALILRGSRELLSPILMTSLCTGLALLPLAVTGDPMARTTSSTRISK